MKSNLKIAIASSALLLSGAVCAMDFDPKFSVGAEAGINQFTIKDKTDGDSWKKTAPSVGALLGVRLIENMGLELGYTAFGAFKGTDVDANESFSTKLRSPHMDVLGYLPVSSDFDLIAAIGTGRVTGKSKITTASTGATEVESFKIKANALRLGLGVQYKFDENLSARLMLRRQNLGSVQIAGKKVTDQKMNFNSAGLGLFYQF